MIAAAPLPRPAPARVARRGGPVVVELVGLPGSGKTTVAGLLRAELASRGYRVAGVERVVPDTVPPLVRLPLRAAALLRAPGLAARTLRYLASARSPGAEGLRFGIGLPAWPLRIRDGARRGDDFLLWDEGAVQGAWAVSLRSGRWSAAALAPLLRRLYAPGARRVCFVHLDVPDEVALERIRRKRFRRGRFVAVPEARARDLLTGGRAALGEMLRLGAHAAGATCLRLDGTAAPASTLRAILPLLELLHDPPPPCFRRPWPGAAP